MILIVWFIAFMLSCSENRHYPDADNKKENTSVQSDEVQLWIRQWKADSLGCQKLRTKAMAESIIDSLNLQNANRTDFLKVFGSPNTTYLKKEAFVASYYFDALCVNGNLIDSADRCIAEFTFNREELVQRNYICY